MYCIIQARSQVDDYAELWHPLGFGTTLRHISYTHATDRSLRHTRASLGLRDTSGGGIPLVPSTLSLPSALSRNVYTTLLALVSKSD